MDAEKMIKTELKNIDRNKIRLAIAKSKYNHEFNNIANET